MSLRPMMGLLNPETKKATAFYALLGVLVGDVWHRGLTQWNLVAVVLFAGLGSLSGLAHLIHGAEDPPKPPTPPKL